MNRFNRFPHLFALSLVLVAGSASSTLALDDKDAGLGGPAVKDESVKGQPRKLSGGAPDRREGAQRVPHRGFLRAVMSLQKEDAPANLRLTEAQITSIKEANQKFVDSVTEYVNQHKNEIEKLRESLPGMERRRVDGFLNMSKDIASLRNLDDVEKAPAAEDRKPEGKPAEGEKVDEAKAKDAREQLKNLVENAPKPADTHAAILAVLTAEQKTYVQEQGEKMRARGPREGRGEGRGEGEGMGEGQRLSPEQREKLKNMSPEERREALKKMREGKEGEGRGKGRGKPNKEDGEKKEGEDQMNDQPKDPR